MQISSPLLLVFIGLTSALIQLESIRNLTIVTDECRERIVSLGGVSQVDEMARVLGGGGQTVLRGGGDDEDEVEDTVAAALRVLCSDLLIELEKPDIPNHPASSQPKPQCQTIIKEYHAFLASTVKFLHEVQERQMYWQWKSDSGVFTGVAWLQGLWASRKANSQDRSFIEQQMSMYAATGCFGTSNEVLRRDVEVVEFMNDLIDSFG